MAGIARKIEISSEDRETFSLIGGGCRNPIDTGGNIDNLVLIASTKPGWRVTPQQMEDDFILMSDIKKSTSKPVIALVYFSTPEAEPEARRIILKFQEIGIPAFPSVQRGARALKNALDYYRLRNDTGN